MHLGLACRNFQRLPRARALSSLYILFLYSIVSLRAATAYPLAVPCQRRHQGRYFLVWYINGSLILKYRSDAPPTSDLTP